MRYDEPRLVWTSLPITVTFGLWSKVFLDDVGLRKDLRAVIWMLDGQVGALQRSPSLPRSRTGRGLRRGGRRGWCEEWARRG